MKKYTLHDRLTPQNGETVLGAKDLGTHACYMIYGKMKSGDAPRVLKPGTGHEEIICCVAGTMKVRNYKGEAVLEEGEAIYLKGDENCVAEAVSDLCGYVAAGGHSDDHHH